VHRSIIVNDDQQDATIEVYLFIPSQLYMFREMSSPIVTSTWLYVFTASSNVHWCCCRPVPAATSVDINRNCKYSQVLLMMDEDIARNM